MKISSLLSQSLKSVIFKGLLSIFFFILSVACNALYAQDIDLEVIKVVDEYFPAEGETVTYTIIVKNLDRTNTTTSIILFTASWSGFRFG